MFYGEYEHNVDGKGRVTLPAKFREELGLSFYMTQGFDTCIVVYPEDQWKKMDDKLRSLKLSVREARAFTRQYFSKATNATYDSQGRVLIPQNLRDYAGIEKDVVIIGVSNRIEIWDKKKWEDYNDNPDFDFDEIFEKLDNPELEI